MSERIAKAREAEKMLRLRFEAEKQAEWLEVSSQARHEVESAVWEAYQAGTPVTQIAVHYGTKNRGTIYEIINKRKQYQTLVPSVAPTTRDLFTVEVTGREAGKNIYRVVTDPAWTHGEHTATFYIEPEMIGNGITYPEEAIFLDRPADTPLHSELRDNWTTSPIANRVRQMEEA